MDLLAPWHSITAARLLCKGVSPPSVHLSRALLLYFVKIPFLTTPIRHVLGHLLERPSTGCGGVSLVHLDWG